MTSTDDTMGTSTRERGHDMQTPQTPQTPQGQSRWERFWTGPVWVKLVACIAIGLAVGLILGAALAKASALPPGEAPVPTTHLVTPAHKCDPTTQTPCPAEARWHAKKFRHGKVDGWKHGIPVKKFYVKPREVQKVWIHKITRLLKQRAHARGTSAAPYSYRRQAIERYTQLVTAGSCATWQKQYPSWDSTHELCTRMPGLGDPDAPKEKWMTADEVKAFGAAALCAGGTVATAVSIPATAGTSATVAVGFGGASCLYGLWASLS